MCHNVPVPVCSGLHNAGDSPVKEHLAGVDSGLTASRQEKARSALTGQTLHQQALGLTLALSQLSKQQQAYRGKCFSTAHSLCAALQEPARKAAAGARSFRDIIHLASLQTH